MTLSQEEMQYFNDCTEDLLGSEQVASMCQYKQHGTTTCLDHSVKVAKYSYWISQRTSMNIDAQSLIRGALLHDFFLYDWHNKNDHKGLHGFTHPEIALENARKNFSINEKEADIIENHMWPLTITKIPHSKESFVVSAMDKYCSLIEAFQRFKRPYKTYHSRGHA